MATLVKNHGRYYLQFYDADRRPARKRVALKTTDKREATKRQKRLESAYFEGRYDPWRDDPRTFLAKSEAPITVSETFERFIDARKAEGKSPNTIRTYESVKRLFVEIANGAALLQSIGPSDIEAFVRDESVSANTRVSRYQNLHAVFNWAKSEGLINRDPFDSVIKPKGKATLPKAVRREELDAICAERPDLSPLFRFAFYTGMRSSELARLQWCDIDRDRGLIYITKQKNGKAQTIPLNRRAAEVLSALEPNGGFVFRGDSQSVRRFVETVSQAFRRAKDRTSIERPVSFHGLRHGFCTALAEAGKSAVVIKEAARHADIQTSMIYVSLSNAHLKSQIDDVF
jgi:integrase